MSDSDSDSSGQTAEPDYSLGGYAKLAHRALSRYLASPATPISTDPASEQTSPDYDTTRLLHMAYLLTGDASLMTNSTESTAALLGASPIPSCDTKVGPFLDLMGALGGADGTPPSYAGTDPIGDIILILRQLASCQKGESGWHKFTDFLTRADGGRTIRSSLLLAPVAIKCLALWYGLKSSGMLNVAEMQNFSAAVFKAQGLGAVDPSQVPASLLVPLRTAMTWTGDLSTVVPNFAITPGSAPVLLVFNDRALGIVMQYTETNGYLPPQGTQVDPAVQQGAESASVVDTVPMIFVPRPELRQYVSQYLQSGPVQPAQ